MARSTLSIGYLAVLGLIAASCTAEEGAGTPQDCDRCDSEVGSGLLLAVCEKTSDSNYGSCRLDDRLARDGLDIAVEVAFGGFNHDPSESIALDQLTFDNEQFRYGEEGLVPENERQLIFTVRVSNADVGQWSPLKFEPFEGVVEVDVSSIGDETIVRAPFSLLETSITSVNDVAAAYPYSHLTIESMEVLVPYGDTISVHVPHFEGQDPPTIANFSGSDVLPITGLEEFQVEFAGGTTTIW